MHESIIKTCGLRGIFASKRTELFLVVTIVALLGVSQIPLLRGQVAAPASNPAVEAPPSAPGQLSAAPESDEYHITPGDSLDVFVYDVPELTHSYTVTRAGTISMPLLPDPVMAAGLTTDQLARAIEAAYRQSGRLQRPVVAVSLSKASLTSSVAVEGSVRAPAIVPVIGRTPLTDVLTQCGGITEDAGSSITITRGMLAQRYLAAQGTPSGPTQVILIKNVLDATDPASQTVVWPGDRVSIERSSADVYYVLGEVRSPGGYNLKKGREELTVLRALALAGDVTNVAKKSKAMIIRKDPSGPQGREEIKLDLAKILLGKTPDPKLQADDILFVPGSNGKKALHTIEGAPGYIVGAAGASAIAH